MIDGLCLDYDTVKLHVNKMDVSFPTQLYIDGTFVNGTSGKKLKSLDPKDESLICEVECASKADVDKACKAAHRAFNVRNIQKGFHVSLDLILGLNFDIKLGLVRNIRFF